MFFAQHSPSGPSNYMHARRLCRGSPLPRFLAQHLDYTPVRMYMQRPRHCQTEGNTVVAKSLVRETSLFAGLFGSPPMMPTPPPPSPHLALGSDLTLSLVGRLSLRKERSVSRSAACSQECQEQYGLRRLQLPFLSFIFISFFLSFFFSFFFFFFFFPLPTHQHTRVLCRQKSARGREYPKH
ncbi:hypothetical protein IWX46DRAFT_244978 [Phyllosticta citricarpa]|uniref:Transmembrane protein n=1 Tax=Phyllosticta citricarpa TaxID=55181 RepID=A0ABR1LRV9_9PEZI